MTNIILTVLFSLALIPGMVMALIPGFPSMIYMVIVALVYGVLNKFTTFTYQELGIISLVAGLAIVFDLISGAVGARWGGAHWRSIFAGFIGLVVGTFLIPVPVVGSIGGLFLGIFFAEYSKKHNFKKAQKAAIGGVIGMLSGTIVNIVASITIFILFLIFVLNS